MHVFEVYDDKAGEGRWRKIAPMGGKIVADSGEGYKGGLGVAHLAARREADPGDRIVKVIVHPDGRRDESLLEIVGQDPPPAELDTGEGEVVDPEGKAEPEA